MGFAATTDPIWFGVLPGKPVGCRLCSTYVLNYEKRGSAVVKCHKS